MYCIINITRGYRYLPYPPESTLQLYVYWYVSMFSISARSSDTMLQPGDIVGCVSNPLQVQHCHSDHLALLLTHFDLFWMFLLIFSSALPYIGLIADIDGYLCIPILGYYLLCFQHVRLYSLYYLRTYYANVLVILEVDRVHDCAVTLKFSSDSDPYRYLVISKTP